MPISLFDVVAYGKGAVDFPRLRVWTTVDVPYLQWSQAEMPTSHLAELSFNIHIEDLQIDSANTRYMVVWQCLLSAGLSPEAYRSVARGVAQDLICMFERRGYLVSYNGGR
jgi:hypothetical protein